MDKGFHYSLEKEDLLNYMRLSTADKLAWLEEIAEFTEKALTEDGRMIRHYFRTGERLPKEES